MEVIDYQVQALVAEKDQSKASLEHYFAACTRDPIKLGDFILFAQKYFKSEYAAFEPQILE